ncbi:PDR/VanB family oxidoreductase [Gordonia sp. CPCC 205515]|uniref:PDR/VanB family oxidoreductase n=1 Tax=Gordonia sp. CPCC 205515 TaxID=3140791 RepID=UPI003AF3C2BC
MSPLAPDGPTPDGLLPLRVEATRREAAGITSFELASVDGTALPTWEPGAHIDVHLPSGTVRQYSLCGDPNRGDRYRIGVLELSDGRGGSIEAHRELRCGAMVAVGTPRQNFPFVEHTDYVFVAGGIGVTPLLPMMTAAARAGRSWRLFYAARSADHFAFRDEIALLPGGDVRLIEGPLDLDQIVTAAAEAEVYCCGPSGLMDALAGRMSAGGRGTHLHCERFSATVPAPADTDSPSPASFEVELAQSGQTITVDDGVSVLEAIRSAGVEHPSSCEMGFCGTCEVKVLSGIVDHRDDLLTDDEKAAGATMMPCVSRGACARLVLDV